MAPTRYCLGVLCPLGMDKVASRESAQFRMQQPLGRVPTSTFLTLLMRHGRLPGVIGPSAGAADAEVYRNVVAQAIEVLFGAWHCSALPQEWQ